MYILSICDGRPVQVEAEFSSGFSGSWFEPSEPAGFEITDVLSMEGESIFETIGADDLGFLLDQINGTDRPLPSIPARRPSRTHAEETAELMS